MLRIELPNLRARTRIACASLPDKTPRQRDSLLRAAEKDIAQITEEGRPPLPRAHAAMAQACVATVEGKMQRARGSSSAPSTPTRQPTWRSTPPSPPSGSGRVTPVSAEALIANATARLNAQGVRSPERVALMFAPGHWSR
ncbi:MAG: hypothetical protein R3F14_31125 [Polyangiaceae bacterium]